MLLPDLTKLSDLHVTLVSAPRAQQHGRYIFCLKQNSLPRFWLKFQCLEHEALLTSFKNEIQIYSLAENHGNQPIVLPHQIINTLEILPWLHTQMEIQGIDTAFSQRCTSSAWYTQALLITHAELLVVDSLENDVQAWLTLCFQYIEALIAFHSFAIHGDLKAAHFVRYEQQSYLIDFERSRAIEHINNQTAIHATPHYMAPELFHGHSTTMQSDYYALGVILLESYLKKRLIAKTYMDWALLHCQSNLLEDVKDTSVYVFLRGLLAKNSAERYQNEEELRWAYQKMSEKLK